MWRLETAGFMEKVKDEELDYTAVYLSGYYDGEKKVKEKIKELIEDMRSARGMEYDWYNALDDISDFLEEE